MLRMDSRLARLLDLLDDADNPASAGATAGTSVRLPTALKEAAALAGDLGLASSASDLTARGLHAALLDVAQRAVLDEHYRVHPRARPDLAEVTIALAQLDGDPLGEDPRLLRRAIGLLRKSGREPRPDEVLLFAAGLAAGAA